MNKKIYTFKDGRIVQIKGKELEKVNSIYTTERMPIKEVLEKYPEFKEWLEPNPTKGEEQR